MPDTGASGAGKEEPANCLQRGTAGAEALFVAVNAASLPECLVEAELFGDEKGAFTGATRTHRGKFEQGHGGPLFLDGFGALPLAPASTFSRRSPSDAVPVGT